MAEAKLKKPKKLLIPEIKRRLIGTAQTTDDLLERLKAEQKKRKKQKSLAKGLGKPITAAK